MIRSIWASFFIFLVSDACGNFDLMELFDTAVGETRALVRSGTGAISLGRSNDDHPVYQSSLVP